MIRVSSNGQVGFERSLVFNEAINPKTWPNVEWLSLQMNSEEIAVGGLLVAMVSARGHEMPVECEITEIAEGQHMIISGESKHANATIRFDFRDSQVGTQIQCGMRLKPRTTKAKLAVPMVRQLLGLSMPNYMSRYCQRISHNLSPGSLATRVGQEA